MRYMMWREDPLAHEWALASALHSGDTTARAAIAARFDVVCGYLMLRGGTSFLKACRAAAAEERWGALVRLVADLEQAHLRDKYIRREGGRLVRALDGDYSIPKNIDPGGPLFPVAS